MTQHMLLNVHVRNVGSISDLKAVIGHPDQVPDVFHLVKGNNRTGKSLLLDSIWYALTRSYGETHPLSPTLSQQDSSSLYAGCGNGKIYCLDWNRKGQFWDDRSGSYSTYPGIILHLRGDGRFSLWDSIRTRLPNGVGALMFSDQTIDIGLVKHKGKELCKGMYWGSTFWNLQRESSESKMLCSLVKNFLDLEVGPGIRYSIDNVRSIPSLIDPSAEDPVPIHLAGAFALRWFRFSYLLTWALHRYTEYREHFGASGDVPLLVLVDDIEQYADPANASAIMSKLPAIVSSLAESVKGIRNTPQVIATTRTDVPSGVSLTSLGEELT